MVIGMGVLAALFVAGLFLLPRVDTTFKVPRLLNPRQITFDAGAESNPSASEDGRLVAYTSSQSGGPDIWVTQLGGGESINRTPDDQAEDFFPTVSPDGSQIAFLSLRDGGMGTFVMPTLAGRPRKVQDNGTNFRYSRAQWSRDGTRLTYAVSDTDTIYVETRTLPSGKPRRIALPGRGRGRFDLSWSPDERFVAYVDAPGPDSPVTQLWLLGLEDSEVIPLTDGRASDRTPSWSPDGRAIYFVSNRGAARIYGSSASTVRESWWVKPSRSRRASGCGRQACPRTGRKSYMCKDAKSRIFGEYLSDRSTGKLVGCRATDIRSIRDRVRGLVSRHDAFGFQLGPRRTSQHLDDASGRRPDEAAHF